MVAPTVNRYGKPISSYRKLLDSRPCTVSAEAPSHPEPAPTPMSGWDDGMTHAIRVADLPEPGPRPFLVERLLPEGAITTLYGDAGTGKSYLALAIATSICAGLPFLDLPTLPGPVLYADFELDADEFRRRAGAVARGLGLDGVPDELWYLHPERSLKGGPDGALGIIGPDIEQLQPALLVIDSFSWACGTLDLSSPSDMNDILGRIAALETSTLLLDHSAKPQAGVPASMLRPFGSAFKFAHARSALQLLKDGAAITLKQVKSNFAALAEPIGVALDFEEEPPAVTVRRLASAVTSQQAPQPTTRERVLAVLRTAGRPLSAEDIVAASRCNRSVQTVRNLLTKLDDEGIAQMTARGHWELHPVVPSHHGA